jgi:hypothetical protein
MDPAQRDAFREQYRGKLRIMAQRQTALAELATTPSKLPRRAPDPAPPPTDVEEFRDDDDGYLAWLAGHPHGYVINILKGLNPRTARIHRAGAAPSPARRHAEGHGPVRISRSAPTESMRSIGGHLGTLALL